MKSRSLKGKHALITGGAKGIGLEVARVLAGHGASVTVLGRDRTSLSRAVSVLRPHGDAALVVADVTDPKAVARATKSAVKRFGPVSILVNNAGQAASSSFLKMSDDLWHGVFAVNVDGTYHCIQAILPGMIDSGWGRIVNMASTAGLVGYPYVTAYCAAKHAVVGLTRALALETAKRGVTVNAVCPGYTETEMLQRALENIVARTGRSLDQARAELVSGNPQGRFVKPEEVAQTVAWLCLPGSESITGQTIAVAGGEVM